MLKMAYTLTLQPPRLSMIFYSLPLPVDKVPPWSNPESATVRDTLVV